MARIVARPQGSIQRAAGMRGAVTDDEHPREDDRNEELDDSPVPDPTEGEADAEDVPGAD